MCKSTEDAIVVREDRESALICRICGRKLSEPPIEFTESVVKPCPLFARKIVPIANAFDEGQQNLSGGFAVSGQLLPSRDSRADGEILPVVLHRLEVGFCGIVVANLEFNFAEHCQLRWTIRIVVVSFTCNEQRFGKCVAGQQRGDKESIRLRIVFGPQPDRFPGRRFGERVVGEAAQGASALQIERRQR